MNNKFLLPDEIRRISKEVSGENCKLENSIPENENMFWIIGQRHTEGAIPRLLIKINESSKSDFNSMTDNDREKFLLKLRIDIGSKWEKEVIDTTLLKTSTEPKFYC